MPGGWRGSNRREQLSPLFYRLRPDVLARDAYKCQWVDVTPIKDYGSSVTVHVSDEIVRDSKTICGEYATDVDHINGHEDTLENLQSLCSYHHDKKSSAEGNAARWKHNNRRNKEKHSGIKSFSDYDDDDD